MRDTQTQRLFIVAIQSIFVLGFAIEMYRSANAVKNVRLTKIFWKAAFITCIFFAARIAASWLDNIYFGFETGYFGAVVLTGGFILIHYRAWHLRTILANTQNADLRTSLRDDIDVIISRIDQARTNARKLLRNV